MSTINASVQYRNCNAATTHRQALVSSCQIAITPNALDGCYIPGGRLQIPVETAIPIDRSHRNQMSNALDLLSGPVDCDDRQRVVTRPAENSQSPKIRYVRIGRQVMVNNHCIDITVVRKCVK